MHRHLLEQKRNGGRTLKTVGYIVLAVSAVFCTALAVVAVIARCCGIDDLPDVAEGIFGIASMFGVVVTPVFLYFLSALSSVFPTVLTVLIAALYVLALVLVRKKGLKFYLIPVILTGIESFAMVYNVFMALIMAKCDGSWGYITRVYLVPTAAKAVVLVLFIALFVRGVIESKYDYVLTEEEKEHIFK
ncbi:MAG: hypothetical protein IJR90_09325 [Clostridia bacterium]|nr:hypothetical protein [Clostridia bacterium]